jgi:HprK-related kinase B
MDSLNSLLSKGQTDCPHLLALNLGGYLVHFKTNSMPLIAELSSYYQFFLATEDQQNSAPDKIVTGLQCAAQEIKGDWQVKQPDPGKLKVKEHLLQVEGGKLIYKVLTGLHLFFRGAERFCFGPLEDHPNQVVNFINNMHLEHLLLPGGQLFHASGACLGDNGLGMAGLSGKGKSTLALRLLQRGMDLVSNDRLVVSEQSSGLLMQGITKYPRINPGTVINQPELADIVSPKNLARYNAMSFDELWMLEEKYDAFVESAFDCSFNLNARMRMFVALDWDRNSSAPLRLELRDPNDCVDLVKNIMKSPGIMLPEASKRIPEAVVEPYLALLSQCDFYVLSGKVDFDQAADKIKTIIQKYA